MEQRKNEEPLHVQKTEKRVLEWEDIFPELVGDTGLLIIDRWIYKRMKAQVLRERTSWMAKLQYFCRLTHPLVKEMSFLKHLGTVGF